MDMQHKATNYFKSWWAKESEKNITIDSLVKLKQEVEQKLGGEHPDYTYVSTYFITTYKNL